jgi:hypothetical protein
MTVLPIAFLLDRLPVGRPSGFSIAAVRPMQNNYAGALAVEFKLTDGFVKRVD